jgi:phospholipid-translocating ATPase
MHHFGNNLAWWATFIVATGVLAVGDLAIDACKKWWWPTQVEIWQELEQDAKVRKKLKDVGGEGGYGVRALGIDEDELGLEDESGL